MPDASILPPALPTASEATTWLTGVLTNAVTENPLLLAVAGFFALVAVIHRVNSNRKKPTDPSRLFSAIQRIEGFARAGGRCELEILPFIRCRRDAHHGDHFLPWSKGGSTSMGNFVAACARCNTSKGSKVPTAFATFRLEMRRRRYFPQGMTAKPGELYLQR